MGLERIYIARPRFEEPFERILESDEEPRILNLHSTVAGGRPVGGMGKSRLLERYAEICDERGIRNAETLDFRHTEYRPASSVVRQITPLDPDEEHGVFASYWTSRRAFDAIRKRRDVPEMDYRDMEEQMDRYFVQGLDALLAKEKLAVFLDTWEAVAGTRVEEWLRQVLLAQLQNLHNLVLVIAGRPPLGWQDIPVKVVEVGPFTLDETQAYAHSRSYEDDPLAAKVDPASQIVANVHQASGGHPVLVAWAFDYGDRGIDVKGIALKCKGDVEAFRRRLVEETRPQEDPLLAWSACLYRRFDTAILQHISGKAQEECKSQIEQLLRDFPSIVRPGESPDSCEPHDEARDMLIEYAWKEMLDPTGEVWQHIREQAIAYYKHQISDPEVALWKRYGYMAERMFYLFDRCTRAESPSDCLKKVFFDLFLPEFDVAINAYQIGLANLLMGEASKFEQYFYEELLNWYDVVRERLLTREGKMEEALDLCHDLLDRPGADDVLKGQVWSGIGRARLLLGEYEDSISAYEKALELREKAGLRDQVAEELSYLGVAYHAKGDWPQAEDHFLRSFHVALEVGGSEVLNRAASAADQAAQVALLMGDAATTRSLGRQALHIWEELGDFSGQASALTTLGRVAEFSAEYREAEALFKEALGLYATGPVPSAFGQAHVNTFLSRVHRRQGRLAEAEGLLEETVGTFRELGRKRQLAFALDELGGVLLDQGKWSEAEGYLGEAIDIAEEIKDRYRLTVIYEDLCVLGRRRGDSPEQIEENLRKVEELAGQWGYQLFLGRVETHRGDLAFEAEDYQAAFDHYVRACHHLAEYHTDFYIRSLSHVEDRLYERPYEEIPTYCDRMMAYWRQHGLDEKHTALMDRFTRAKEMAQSFAE